MLKFLKRYFMPIYVSALDQFLTAFDQAHPQPSFSQRQEQEKFRRIYKLRDGEEKVDSRFNRTLDSEKSTLG